MLIAKFNYCNCSIGPFARVSNQEAAEVIIGCNSVPWWRVVFTAFFGATIIALPLTGTCEKNRNFVIGLNVALISVTALNILWSWCIYKNIAVKGQDEAKILLDGQDWSHKKMKFLNGIKRRELFIGAFFVSTIVTSVISTSIKC